MVYILKNIVVFTSIKVIKKKIEYFWITSRENSYLCNPLKEYFFPSESKARKLIDLLRLSQSLISSVVGPTKWDQGGTRPICMLGDHRTKNEAEEWYLTCLHPSTSKTNQTSKASKAVEIGSACPNWIILETHLCILIPTFWTYPKIKIKFLSLCFFFENLSKNLCRWPWARSSHLHLQCPMPFILILIYLLSSCFFHVNVSPANHFKLRSNKINK